VMWSDIEGMSREWARRLEADLRKYLGSEAGLDDVLFGFLELMRGGRASSGQAGAPRQSFADPYRLLGLSQSATDEEVRKRYRELVRHQHPDTAGVKGTACLFQIVLAAYEMIRKHRGWQ
jgi:DnaJ-domain-containing protein 1